MFDSEQRRAKRATNSNRKSKIRGPSEMARLWRAFCLMSLRVTISGKPKFFWNGGEAKASPKWANLVAGSRPEAEVIYP